MGFKYISAKMQETGAVIGGESSGGLTVRGHIHGKDGIYAAALLVEMMAVSKKKLSEIAEDIRTPTAEPHMEERDYRFTPEEKRQAARCFLSGGSCRNCRFLFRRFLIWMGARSILKMGVGFPPDSQGRNHSCAFSARWSRPQMR